MDTIYALATATGKAGVAVVRVAGPRVGAVAVHLNAVVPSGGRRLCQLRLADGTVIDQALVLHFPEGRSFTGEESLELHLHGSVAVVQKTLAVLAGLKGVRLAEPGEFTRRAFENGRLDLAEVEGLADLIDAETDSQRKQALRVLSGHLGRRVERWRDDLTEALSLLTAAIDFADEDIPETVIEQARGILQAVQKDLRREVEKGANAERVRSGFEVAIVGAPNSGKSTLLNQISGREAAITSEYAGTTRDVIEVRMDLGGLAVTFLDTAGLRDAEDPVERVGIERAKERALSADMRVFLRSEGDQVLLEPEVDDLVYWGKADLWQDDRPGVSGLTGAGVQDMLSAIAERLGRRVSESAVVVRERHRRAAEEAIAYLGEADQLFAAQGDLALAVEMIHSSVRAMDSLVGKIGVEAILGRIFESFCVGK